MKTITITFFLGLFTLIGCGSGADERAKGAKHINDSLRVDSIAKAKHTKDSIASAISSKNDTIELNKGIIAYFSRVAQLANDNKPAYRNAANGNFRDKMASAELNALANPKLDLSTQDAKNLFDVFTTFAQGNQDAFNRNPNYKLPHKGCCGTDTKVIMNSFGAIAYVISDIATIIASEGADAVQIAGLTNDLKNTYNSIAKSHYANVGANASGHISEGVATAASRALTKLNKYNNYNASTKSGKIALVLRTCFKDLLKLQTKGHSPWLLPSWQLQYYATIKATSIKLSNL
jgi:hypothetical protein